MGLSRVFFRAGKAAMMDDVISGDPETLIRVAGKIRKWIARKRWRQSIWAVVSIIRLGRLIEDIREERRRREEEKRLASEEYQRELRKKREEEERILQEELRRRDVKPEFLIKLYKGMERGANLVENMKVPFL